jgi:hypothetical protein
MFWVNSAKLDSVARRGGAGGPIGIGAAGRKVKSIMARCERGYLCEVCGAEVEELTESDLYLRYVLGEVDPKLLHKLPERHIRCNPVLAQFIVAAGWTPITIEGAFAKSELDPRFVALEELRVTRGYLRLRELGRLGLPIHEYPLTESGPEGPSSEASPR